MNNENSRYPFFGPNAKPFARQIIILALLVIAYNVFFESHLKTAISAIFDVIWPLELPQPVVAQ